MKLNVISNQGRVPPSGNRYKYFLHKFINLWSKTHSNTVRSPPAIPNQVSSKIFYLINLESR
jgi:hypothetical protein